MTAKAAVCIVALCQLARAAPGKKPAALDLSITVPATVTSFNIDGAWVEPAPPGKQPAWFRQQLDEREHATFESEESLPDGWAVRFKRENGVIATAAYRTLGDRTILCIVRQDRQPAADLARAGCLGIERSPDGLVVPFSSYSQKPGLGGVNLQPGIDLVLKAAPRGAPTTPASAIRGKPGGRIIGDAKLATGFAIAYRYDGGFGATARLALGKLDLLCTSWPEDYGGAGAPTDARGALAIMNACASIRVRQ